ncbi:MAG: glycosyltransferase family 2 protein [Candidatus Omnitrophica bacterium]|nr:glycosyltransferase family 2 protein [Candidatus Omnitrophota bacterium]
MDISVVLCTWKNSRRLGITLEALSHCVVPQGVTWELVLVNNHSADETERVAKDHTERLPIVYVEEPLPGLSRARNKGLSLAKGDLIVFTDDDVRPCVDWLTFYWRAYRTRPEGYFFGGRIVSEFETERFDREMIKHAPLCIRGLDWGGEERILREDEYFIGANWAAPLEMVRRAGGYDVTKGLNAVPGRTTTGEEADLMNRMKHMGYRPLYLPDAAVHHFVPERKLNGRHIGRRLQASGYAYAGLEVPPAPGPYIGNLPRWIYKRIALRLMRYGAIRLRGGKGYQDYFDLRFDIGYALGLRDLASARHDRAVSK